MPKIVDRRLHDFLLRVAGENGEVSEERLEQWLTKISGRVVDGYCLVKEVSSDGRVRFGLRKAD
jgi:hypothetical protein